MTRMPWSPSSTGAPSDGAVAPDGPARRRFLKGSIAVGSVALLGGGAAILGDALGWFRGSPSERLPDPLRGGRLLGTLPFVTDEPTGPPFHVQLGEGLDARLFTDLSALDGDRLITPNDRFFLRTACPDALPPAAAWKIRARGLLKRDVDISLDTLRPLVTPMGVHLLECAGNNNPWNFGLISAAAWAGVPLASILEKLEILPHGTRVLVSGFDRHSGTSRNSIPGASWIFSLDELTRAGAFLATEMNGVALPLEHGFPVRLVVPGWYGCTCIKWVDEIHLLDEAALATAHMTEFARRTHQQERPRLACDFTPARIDRAAMPVRIEKWLVPGGWLHRVVGILWGGSTPSAALAIRFNPGEPYRPVSVSPLPNGNATWTLWSCLWKPAVPGRYRIVLRIDDSSAPTRRLDEYFYAREVFVHEV